MKTFFPNNNLPEVPEITPEELAKELEGGAQVQIVDVRLPSNVSPVGLMPPAINIVGSSLLRHSDLSSVGVSPAKPVVTVCAHGNDSRIAAMHLNNLGANARSLSGGMAAWMNLILPRTIAPPPTIDEVIQFDRVGKEALSYVVISSGEAIIIDPPRDPDPLLGHIDASGARLVGVADTHVHADYLSGASSIARDKGVPYYLHPDDNIYPYDNRPGRLDIAPVSDGMAIRCGNGTLVVRHTPGHSPGSVTYVIGDEAAFSGDFLFINSVGRPDIADKTDEWAVSLWSSLQAARKNWPASLQIFPAHYSSTTNRGSGGVIGERFGSLQATNSSLNLPDEAAFVQWVRKNIMPVPTAYRTIKAINVGLLAVSDMEAEFLENGKNECALG